ncbi:unnamed protein product [Lepidochelys kempii]
MLSLRVPTYPSSRPVFQSLQPVKGAAAHGSYAGITVFLAKVPHALLSRSPRALPGNPLPLRGPGVQLPGSGVWGCRRRRGSDLQPHGACQGSRPVGRAGARARVRGFGRSGLKTFPGAPLRPAPLEGESCCSRRSRFPRPGGGSAPASQGGRLRGSRQSLREAESPAPGPALGGPGPPAPRLSPPGAAPGPPLPASPRAGGRAAAGSGAERSGRCEPGKGGAGPGGPRARAPPGACGSWRQRLRPGLPAGSPRPSGSAPRRGGDRGVPGRPGATPTPAVRRVRQRGQGASWGHPPRTHTPRPTGHRGQGAS